MTATLYAAAVAAFDDAEWTHGDPNEHGTMGTHITVDGRIIGGSLSVRDDGVVRFLAFGVHHPVHDETKLHRLFGVVNPVLPTGSFEIHPILGPVCRCSADLSSLVADDGAVAAPDVAGELVLHLATAATGVFEGFVNILDEVAAGADPDEVLASHGWVTEGWS